MDNYGNYDIKVIKPGLKIRIRSKDKGTNKKQIALQNPIIFKLASELAVTHFQMTRPGVREKSCKFCKTGTDEIVKDFHDLTKWKEGDYEPVLELHMMEN